MMCVMERQIEKNWKMQVRDIHTTVDHIFVFSLFHSWFVSFLFLLIF